MKSTDLLSEILVEFDNFKLNAAKENNKAAKQRARKSTLKLSKMFKQYRELTIEEAK